LLSARKSSLLRKIARNVLSLHEHVFVAHIKFPPFPPNPVSSSDGMMSLSILGEERGFRSPRGEPT
jgi:hypothetical protein